MSAFYRAMQGMQSFCWVFFPLTIFPEVCCRVTVYVKSSVSQHFIFRLYVNEMLVVTVTGSPHEGCLIAWELCCQWEELAQETFGKICLV